MVITGIQRKCALVSNRRNVPSSEGVIVKTCQCGGGVALGDELGSLCDTMECLATVCRRMGGRVECTRSMDASPT